ncbi:MAG: hypothetical protein AB8F74_02465 [Saprospiraceae bacterium]
MRTLICSLFTGCFTLIVFTGCLPKYSSDFILTTFEFEENHNHQSKVVSVLLFEDERSENPKNSFFFSSKKRIVESKEGTKCINAERFYKEPVADELTKVTAAYLNRTDVFKQVVFNKKENVDYYIKANLTNFKVIQDYTQKAQSRAVLNSFIFGLGNGPLGPPMRRSIEEDSWASIHIELQDVILLDKAQNTIANLGSVDLNQTGMYPADASCWCAYWNAEDAYPQVVEELLNKLLPALDAHQK